MSIVNAENSESWNLKDKECFHSIIKNEVGYSSSCVIGIWLLHIKLKTKKNDTKEKMELMTLVATLCNDQGKYDMV